METFGAAAVAILVCGGMVWALLSARSLAGDGNRSASRRSPSNSPVVRCVDRGSKWLADKWTEIDVGFPIAYPLSLNVRRHGWRDHKESARGNMVDLQLGDPLFDAEFLVEAAPAEVVKRLLDERVRRFLLEEPAVELFTIQETPGVIRLALRDWRDSSERTEAVELVSEIATGVRSAYIAVGATSPPPIGAPYREEQDGAAARQAESAREAEIHQAAKQLDDKRIA